MGQQRIDFARLIEDALASEPNREDRDILALHAGEHRRLMGHADQARAWFSRVLSNSPKSKEAQAAALAIVLLDGTQQHNGLVSSMISGRKFYPVGKRPISHEDPD